mmetsp:Transcript_4703/g.14213  ORF Transcript_4703/g.14213 Transcript_4703/m.14213 type:complete len:209 (-) Transcript_4703:159-785(-)
MAHVRRGIKDLHRRCTMRQGRHSDASARALLPRIVILARFPDSQAANYALVLNLPSPPSAYLVSQKCPGPLPRRKSLDQSHRHQHAQHPIDNTCGYPACPTLILFDANQARKNSLSSFVRSESHCAIRETTHLTRSLSIAIGSARPQCMEMPLQSPQRTFYSAQCQPARAPLPALPQVLVVVFYLVGYPALLLAMRVVYPMEKMANVS